MITHIDTRIPGCCCGVFGLYDWLTAWAFLLRSADLFQHITLGACLDLTKTN